MSIIKKAIAFMLVGACIFTAACGLGENDTDISSGDSNLDSEFNNTSFHEETFFEADFDTELDTQESEKIDSTDHNAGESIKKPTEKVSDRSEEEKETSSTKPASSSTIENILNKAKLNPMKTGNVYLDEKVEEIFSQIFKPGMTTYDKVKACYDYLITKCSYGGGIIDFREVQALIGDTVYEQPDDELTIYLAYKILTSHVGVCDHYSSAFLVMTRAIGLDSYIVTGTVKRTGGGRAGHAWTNIKINNVYYVFDPQVGDNSSKNGKINYYFFGQTDAQMGTMYEYYNREEDINRFGYFKIAGTAVNDNIN